jgi:hypothetical protein
MGCCAAGETACGSACCASPKVCMDNQCKDVVVPPADGGP